jgi:hypothetical protein
VIVAKLAILAVVSSGLASCGGSDHVSPVTPSDRQLSAMAAYYTQHLWHSQTGASTKRVGCVVLPIGTGHGSDRQLIAYTRVLCQQCPAASGDAILDPTVFSLDGAHVRSAADVTDDDQAGFEQFKKLFPRSLWSSAYQSLGPAPLAHRVEQRAKTIGGCGRS